MQPDISVDHN